MKYLLKSSIFSVILLMALSACMNVPLTEIPGGLPVTILPTATATTVTPHLLEIPTPVEVSAGNVLVKPSPVPCSAPAPSIKSSTLFCANHALGLGGATVILNAFEASYSPLDTVTCIADTTSVFKLTCSGPQSTNFQIESCGTCGGGDKVGSAVFGNYTCSKGYVKKADGSCLPAPAPAPATDAYYTCPVGSHYDNAQQYCLDDVSGLKISDLCPAGTVTYLPDYHYCLTKGYSEVYNCQTFTVPLGVCSDARKPAGGVICPAGQTWKVNRATGLFACQ